MKGKLNWRKAIVTGISDAAPDVRVIEFAVEDAETVFAFSPGSHTTFELPLDGGAVHRSYSCLPSLPGTIRVGVEIIAVPEPYTEIDRAVRTFFCASVDDIIGRDPSRAAVVDSQTIDPGQ